MGNRGMRGVDIKDSPASGAESDAVRQGCLCCCTLREAEATATTCATHDFGHGLAVPLLSPVVQLQDGTEATDDASALLPETLDLLIYLVRRLIQKALCLLDGLPGPSHEAQVGLVQTMRPTVDRPRFIDLRARPGEDLASLVNLQASIPQEDGCTVHLRKDSANTRTGILLSSLGDLKTSQRTVYPALDMLHTVTGSAHGRKHIVEPRTGKD